MAEVRPLVVAGEAEGEELFVGRLEFRSMGTYRSLSVLGVVELRAGRPTMEGSRHSVL